MRNSVVRRNLFGDSKPGIAYETSQYKYIKEFVGYFAYRMPLALLLNSTEEYTLQKSIVRKLTSNHSSI